MRKQVWLGMEPRIESITLMLSLNAAIIGEEAEGPCSVEPSRSFLSTALSVLAL